MTRSEAAEQYSQARRRGMKEYREAALSGRYPYLPVLDDILQNANVEAQLPIGIVEVPLKLVVGTKTAGRTAAFSYNFMPLLGTGTEFSVKWITLCQAHVEEGIRDPIRCYEYLGSFYVQEGNKRVSVMKYFDAASITANVTRIVPKFVDNPVIRAYYDFMDFYPLCGMYELKICRDYRDGKVTKEELDKCSTCDMNCVINNGLSEASKEQLKHKTGEEIVDADIAQQMETK